MKSFWLRSLIFFMFTLVFCAVSTPAQQAENDGDQVVSVPKKYVSAEGLTHQASAPTTPQKVSEWVGVMVFYVIF